MHRAEAGLHLAPHPHRFCASCGDIEAGRRGDEGAEAVGQRVEPGLLPAMRFTGIGHTENQ